MKFLWCLLVLGLLAAVSEAKRKRKFEGDFEFADEDESRSKAGDKKRWIHDPNSDLCHPLNCKKKELCLLEDDFTAVCVSKKELHKNGDVVISKAKLLAEEEEARRRAALEDDADADDDDDDDVFYDTEDDPDDQEDDSGETVSCKSCPVTKPTFLCGSNNRTFSSLCRLDYHNCIHQTNIRVACKGFCPCKESDMHLRKKQRQAERYMNKYKSVEKKSGVDRDASPRQDRYTFTPEDFKYENKHYKYIKYTKYNKDGYNKLNNPIYSEDKERQRGYNDVLDTKPSQRSSSSQSNKSTCPPASLQAMANRLLDWFSVIMADTNKRRSRTHPKYKSAYFPSGCKSEVRWMFGHLDSDADGRLSMQELYDLEHDRNEPCIRPFLQQCTAGSNSGGSSTSSASANQQVTPRDWCHCFDHADRPCAAVKRRITPELMGVYVPDCDSQGYYRSTQCHSAIGMCWCVDKHGVEYANTRTRGKPNCDTLVAKSASSVQQTNENNTDDEDGDDVEQEGSADQPLDF